MKQSVQKKYSQIYKEWENAYKEWKQEINQHNLEKSLQARDKWEKLMEQVWEAHKECLRLYEKENNINEYKKCLKDLQEFEQMRNEYLENRDKH